VGRREDRHFGDTVDVGQGGGHGKLAKEHRVNVGLQLGDLLGDAAGKSRLAFRSQHRYQILGQAELGFDG